MMGAHVLQHLWRPSSSCGSPAASPAATVSTGGPPSTGPRGLLRDRARFWLSRRSASPDPLVARRAAHDAPRALAAPLLGLAAIM
jgi:hypothetical protein